MTLIPYHNHVDSDEGNAFNYGFRTTLLFDIDFETNDKGLKLSIAIIEPSIARNQIDNGHDTLLVYIKRARKKDRRKAKDTYGLMACDLRWCQML